MAFISAEEIADGRSFQYDGEGAASITRVFRVTASDKHDVPLQLQSSMPVAYGQLHPIYDGLRCLGESWENEHTGPGQSIWIATYTYRSQAGDQAEFEAKEFHPNPLDRRCRCSVSAVRYGELSERDRDGHIKRTSAGEIYEPIEKDATRYVINLSKNYQTIPSWVWDLQDKINDAPVTIRGRTCAIGTLKFSLNGVPEIAIENNHRFFPISWTLDYKREGWKDRRVDAGFYYLNNDTPRKQMAIMVDVDDDGDGEADRKEPAVVAQWLDGSGNVLRDTNDNPQPGDETILEFDDYEEGDFSEMPLEAVASASAEV